MSRPDPELVHAIMAALDGDGGALEQARELLEAGANPNGISEGHTLLENAVAFDKIAVAEVLLDNGAYFEISTRTYGSKLVPGSMGSYAYSAVSDCDSSAMASLLGRYDPPFEHFEAELLPHATGAALIQTQGITEEIFNHRSLPRFGTSNAELCNNPFYLDQIRTGQSGYAAGQAVLGNKHEGNLVGPVWSFQRFGRSFTRLADGRLVLIAGEHEDFYDPDFNIYNDVTVLDGAGGVQHFLYPQEIFPPTDFHSATLLEDHILLIGNLGYKGERHEGMTQVLRLNLTDFSMEPVTTAGDNPGWISRHKAIRVDDDIVVSGGKTEPGYIDQKDDYALNLSTMTWHRIS